MAKEKKKKKKKMFVPSVPKKFRATRQVKSHFSGRKNLSP